MPYMTLLNGSGAVITPLILIYMRMLSLAGAITQFSFLWVGSLVSVRSHHFHD